MAADRAEPQGRGGSRETFRVVRDGYNGLRDDSRGQLRRSSSALTSIIADNCCTMLLSIENDIGPACDTRKAFSSLGPASLLCLIATNPWKVRAHGVTRQGFFHC